MRTVVLVLLLLRACVAWGELTCAQTPNDVCAPIGVTVAGRLMSYVDASGNADSSCTATCAAGTLTGALTGNASTATALAANGANCSAGQAALGVDASGAVESCFTPPTAFNCPSQIAAPVGGLSLPAAGANTAIPTNVGQLMCGRFTMPCNMTATQLAYQVRTAGAAGSQCAAAVYTSDGNTKVLDSGVKACATLNQNQVTSGLSGTLTAGNDYYVCFAASVSATMTYLSSLNSGSTLFNAITTTVLGLGPTAAASVAQFNDACTGASGSPYTCCTSADNGTCTGMPSVIGTMSTSANAPLIAIIGL